MKLTSVIDVTDTFLMIQTAQVPLEKYEIEKLVKTLDCTNAGKITYQ